MALLCYVLPQQLAYGRECRDWEWQCADGLQCVPAIFVCDGDRLCRDGSDESDATCSTWDCAPHGWKCADGQQCVHPEEVCDGERNCRDSSDESFETCGTVYTYIGA